MSNLVQIYATKFTNIASASPSESFGYRIFDDYGCSYSNPLNQGDPALEDDLLLLEYILKNDNDDMTEEILHEIKARRKTVIINGNHYSWRDIEHLWRDDDPQGLNDSTNQDIHRTYPDAEVRND